MRARQALSAAAIIALLLPSAVAAQSAEALTAQIAALMQQIQAVQAQIGAAHASSARTSAPVNLATSPTSSCPRFTRNLARGAKGDDVLALQRYLGGEGLLMSDSQTGYFGALTEAALQQWQATYKVASTGTPATTGWGALGPRTIRMIDLNCTARVNTPAVPPPDPTTAQNACPLAPRPASLCPGSWHAVSGANGCTASWQCVVPLGGATSSVSLPSTAPTPIDCPINPRPQTACSGSWQAASDARGCTSSWRCM